MSSVAKLPRAPLVLSTVCARVPGVCGTVVVSLEDEKDTIGRSEGRATIGWNGANHRLGQLLTAHCHAAMFVREAS